MSIIITINSETAAEAQAQVLDLSAVMGGNPIRAVVTAEAPKVDKPKRNNAASKPEKEPETTKGATPPADPDPADTDESGDNAPAPTAIELRAKASEVGADPANKPKIKALLTEFGVPNITAVPEDRRAEFMERLEAL